jgi:protoporphyrinogen oxidase
VTAREGSLAWENPEALKGDIMESLVRLGLTVGPEEVVGVEIERIPNAYPIYTLGYRQRLREVRSSIEALGNVRLLGRGATFWYNNMDHSMRAAMRLAEDLEQGG